MLNNDKLVKRFLYRVNELFKDFAKNAQLLIALFKLPQNAKLFDQLGPDDICKLLSIEDDSVILGVIAIYDNTPLLKIALQQIHLETANTHLVNIVLVDEQLRQHFFSQAIAKEQLQQQLYELYKKNNEMITRQLYAYHVSKVIGFELHYYPVNS